MTEETRDCLSPTLVRTRRAFVLPFARMAVEALEVIGWDDLAREVKRRVSLYEEVDYTK